MVHQVDGGGLIVDKAEASVFGNQEEDIRKMFHTNRNSAVILLNGSPVDMTGWIDSASAVLEAWYPGEQRGTGDLRNFVWRLFPFGKASCFGSQECWTASSVLCT